jgi:hypothetical protein
MKMIHGFSLQDIDTAAQVIRFKIETNNSNQTNKHLDHFIFLLDSYVPVDKNHIPTCSKLIT